MRRTVWGVLLVLLILAAVTQAVWVVERRHYDNGIPATVESGGRVVKIRGLTLPPRFAVADAPPAAFDTKRSGASNNNRKTPKGAADDRETVWWTGSVESGPHAKTDMDAAYKEALDRACDLLAEKLNLPSRPTRDFVRKYVETKYTPGDGPKDALIETQTVRLDLEFNEVARKQLAQFDRDSRIGDRLETLIRLSIVATALLACIAGYIRLDEYTKGYYTGRLRFVAIALAVCATLGAVRI